MPFNCQINASTVGQNVQVILNYNDNDIRTLNFNDNMDFIPKSYFQTSIYNISATATITNMLVFDTINGKFFKDSTTFKIF